MAEWVRSLNFSALNHSFGHLIAVPGVGSSPTLATCETSQVLLVGVSSGFPGVLPLRPTYRLARLDMSEIILERDAKLKKIKQRISLISFCLTLVNTSKCFGTISTRLIYSVCI